MAASVPYPAKATLRRPHGDPGRQPGAALRLRVGRRLTLTQSIAPARAGELESAEPDLFLHPGADDVIGDGHGRRRAQAAGMAPQEHARDLLAIEPAGVV